MARVDLIDDWSATEQSGSFTYDNGQVLNYTYSGGPAGAEDPNGILDNTAFIGRDYNPSPDKIHDTASIEFDQAVSNVSFAFTSFDGIEKIQFTIDGEVVNLRDLYALGDVSIVSSGSTQGVTSLTTTDGQLHFNENSAVATVTFNYPITTIGIENITGNYAVGMDVLVDSSDPNPFMPCFTAGTLIETDKGAVAVETLQVGDLIRTKDHGFQRIRWIGGSRVYDAPVRIAKGTFGNTRDLVVSSRHRMLLKGWQMGLLFNHDEAFAAAKDMQNGTTITMEPEGWVTYYHILLDRHEVIYAEGAETESFFPDEASLNSMAKKTREELAQTVDLSTFGRTARPTLSANQAMYLSHNMDLLEEDADQIAAQ